MDLWGLYILGHCNSTISAVVSASLEKEQMEKSSLIWDSNVVTKILDLKTLTLCPEHCYFGSENPKFNVWYKYPDLSPRFVASGSSDKFAYLWSREYNCLLGKLEHDNGGIDCAVFDPNDDEILVSTSDDHSIKVWVSRNKIEQTQGVNLVNSKRRRTVIASI